MDIAKIVGLFQKLDKETVSLFMQFVEMAKESSDGPNEFVKKVLRKVVEPKPVNVKVVEVKPINSKKA